MDDGMEGKVEMKISSKGRVNGRELFLRSLALLLTLAAVFIMGLNKQSKVIPIKVLANFSPVDILVTAKWKHQSAFVYYMVANIIACSYAAVSLFVFLANKGGRKRGLAASIIVVLDLVMVALLFSSGSAAGAIGVLGYTGNSHVQWHKVCNSFGKFCEQAAAAVGLSLLGGLAFLLLVADKALGAHNNIPN